MLSGAALVDVHAVAGPRDEVLSRRRATYDAAVEMAVGQPRELANTVVDHPVVRAHLGEVISGVSVLDAHMLTSVDMLVAPTGRWSAGGAEIRVASAESAPEALVGAVRRIGAELGCHSAGGLGDVVLHEGSPGYPLALSTLRSGIDVALAVAPDLLRDLLPHIALIALLNRDRVGRLGSASAREYPGLVVLPAPASSLEAAEALVHEGAHQKLFDLAIVGSMFGDGYHAAPVFYPPWAASGAMGWPLEQTMAAYHAYCCLAAFHESLDRPAEHAYSLLPKAAERSAVLGEWLAEKNQFLGRDGRAFVDGLGERAATASPTPVADAPLPASVPDGAPSVSRTCGQWELTMSPTRPVEIHWQRVGVSRGI